MSTTQPQTKAVAVDAQTDDLDDRSRRALTEPMTAMDSCGDVRGHDNLVEVTTASGSAYIVDTKTDSCTCPDYKHRGSRCKHLRRVAFGRGVEAIPASVDREAIDDNLGAWVEGEVRFAMTDGGVVAKGKPSDAGDGLASKIGYIIGVDADDCAHCYYPATEVVKVYEVGPDYEVGDYIDTEPAHVGELGGRPLSHWMRFVAERRGWITVTHRAPDSFAGGEEVSA